LRRFSAIAIPALVAAGCGQVFLPPPAQRTELPHQVREILDMTGGRPAETWGAVVSGVHRTFEPGADWRWAAECSVFQFRLDEFAGWKLAVRLTAAQAVLDKTGPQHVSFTINSQPAGTAILDASRHYELAFPVDAAVLKSATPIVVTMDAGPCVPDRDGPPFCVLLHSVGFVQEPR
jgi:hypothetical protein